MFRWVPGLQAVSSYQRIWLARDIIAGVVLTTLLVPQGMDYAELAGLPLSPVCTPRSCACSGTRCSARHGSWYWALIPHSAR